MIPSEFTHRVFTGRTRGLVGRWIVTSVLSALAVAVAACGSTATRATSDTTASTATTVRDHPSTGFLAPAIKYGTGSVGAPSPTTSVPTERGGSRPIDPSNDAGQEVIIAKGGFLLPEWLVANVELPITWTNLSGAPQQVVFDDAPVRSPVIAPGGTFTWKSPGFAISLTYHTRAGHHARLTLQNPNGAP